MSPSDFNGRAVVFVLTSASGIVVNYASVTAGIRPVINLRADTTFIYGGTGTASNPYIVVGAE